MNIRTLFPLALLLLSTLAMAQSGKIEFKETAHDFGTIPEAGGDVSHTFEFTNSGDAPIIIHGVSTSCGCTVSEWTHEPVLPGKTGSVTARYSPMGRPNAFSKTLTVRTNGEPESLVLLIKGYVTPRERTPEEQFTQRYGQIGIRSYYISLGRLAANGTLSHQMEVYNFGNEPATVALRDLPSYVKVKPQTLTVPPSDKGSFTLTVDGKSINDWGLISAPFTLKHAEATPRITLAFSREEDFSALSPEERAKAPRIGVDSRSVDFGQVATGEVAKVQFVLRNEGASPLVIRKIAANCGCVTALAGSSELKPGEKVTLTANFATTGYRGRQSKQVTIISNDPTMPTLVLELVGNVE